MVEFNQGVAGLFSAGRHPLSFAILCNSRTGNSLILEAVPLGFHIHRDDIVRRL